MWAQNRHRQNREEPLEIALELATETVRGTDEGRDVYTQETSEQNHRATTLHDPQEQNVIFCLQRLQGTSRLQKKYKHFTPNLTPTWRGNHSMRDEDVSDWQSPRARDQLMRETIH